MYPLDQIYVLQIFTPCEYIITSKHIIFQWEGDDPQRGAGIEYTFIDSFQLATKVCPPQGKTTPECIPFNNSNRFQAHANQRLATSECIFFYYFQLVTFHIRQGFTLFECTSLNNFDASHDNSSQRRAFVKSESFNCCDIIIKFDFFDVWIFTKCPLGNDTDRYIYADMSDIRRNLFVVPAHKNVIFYRHHLFHGLLIEGLSWN
mmetsp:Transcript_31665/g.53600  ORF Transcript_31665/g.53600 Transcript_31665/m.53600 type:complete len:204 (-) Transcript_31665:214-825(-)